MILSRVTSLLGKAVSAVDLLTASFMHLNEYAGYPVGFRIPVPGGNTGLTVLYYTRLLSGQLETYSIYVDGSNGVGGGLHSQEISVRGIFADGFRVNGQGFGYGTRYIYYNKTWAQIALKTTSNTSARGVGELYFNLFAGSTSPTDGLRGVDYAHLAIYQREVPDAELSALLPPADYDQLYTFAGFSPGDTVLVEQTGSGLDGQYIYQ